MPITKIYKGLSKPFCSTDTVFASCLFPLSVTASVTSVVPTIALYAYDTPLYMPYPIPPTRAKTTTIAKITLGHFTDDFC